MAEGERHVASNTSYGLGGTSVQLTIPPAPPRAVIVIDSITASWQVGGALPNFPAQFPSGEPLYAIGSRESARTVSNGATTAVDTANTPAGTFDGSNLTVDISEFDTDGTNHAAGTNTWLYAFQPLRGNDTDAVTTLRYHWTGKLNISAGLGGTATFTPGRGVATDTVILGTPVALTTAYTDYTQDVDVTGLTVADINGLKYGGRITADSGANNKNALSDISELWLEAF